MTYLPRLMALTCLLIAPAAALAGNEIQGTVSAKLDGEERQWFSVLVYGEPTSTYSGKTSPEMVTIEAFADAGKPRAGGRVAIEFSVFGDPAAPVAKGANLFFNPTNSLFPHYVAQYEDIRVTITTIEMSEKSATVAGSFSAKLTRVEEPGKKDGAEGFSTLEGTFQVEAWPLEY